MINYSHNPRIAPPTRAETSRLNPFNPDCHKSKIGKLKSQIQTSPKNPPPLPLWWSAHICYKQADLYPLLSILYSLLPDLYACSPLTAFRSLLTRCYFQRHAHPIELNLIELLNGDQSVDDSPPYMVSCPALAEGQRIFFA
jgi:hypothetical protein